MNNGNNINCIYYVFIRNVVIREYKSHFITKELNLALAFAFAFYLGETVGIIIFK